MNGTKLKSDIKKNISLSNMEFLDKVNVKNAKYIYNLNFNEFRNSFWSKDELDGNNEKWDLKVYYNQVRSFCSEVIKNKVQDKDYAIIKQKYKYANGSTSGRIYVNKFGIQSLQHNLRAFLTGKHLLDIDIKNAHPNILYKIAKEYNTRHDKNLPLYHLHNYINNRQKVLDEHKITKMDVLICLNSDIIITNKKHKGYYTKNRFLLDFHREKMILFENILNDKDFISKYNISSSNNKNPISSKINKLFCIYENDIIQSIIKSKICVPMFDGFMFPVEEKNKYDYLLNETGIIQWDYKLNKIDIDTSDFDEDLSKDYDTIRKTFEKQCCMILSPFIFMKKITDEEKRIVDQYYSKREIKDISEPYRIINKDGKESSFFDEWMKDPQKRQYDKFMFHPYVKKELDDTPDHIYNTFNEYNVETIDDYTEPTWFINFIKENLADYDENSTQYLLNYCADFFQNPNKNIEVALVLRGESGIGKDTFIEILECMMGRNNDYVHRTANINDILPESGFNSCLKNKLLVQFNEVEGRNSLEAKERIKDHVTRKQNNINEKYINSYKQKNLAQVIFCSNNNSPVQFSFDERRFVMFKCGTEHKGDTKYWENIYKNIENGKILNNLYTWLLNKDISEWNPVKDRPQTEAYLTALSNCIPVHIRWLKDIFVDNHIFINDFCNVKDNYFIQPKLLYQNYSQWAEDHFLLESGKFKSNSFRKILSDIKGIYFDKSIKYKGESKKYILFKYNDILEEINKYQFSIETTDDDDELDLDLD